LASAAQDIHEHWDYEIAKEGAVLKIDVKARKRISRSDLGAQDEWLWLEINSVRKEDRGWLYGSKSDLIAFERETDFLIVKTEDLRILVPQKLQLSGNANPKNSKEKYAWADSAPNAQYKLYQRKGRHDVLTLFRFSDLASIVWARWEK
jgi:hypothetical protein